MVSRYCIIVLYFRLDILISNIITGMCINEQYSTNSSSVRKNISSNGRSRIRRRLRLNPQPNANEAQWCFRCPCKGIWYQVTWHCIATQARCHTKESLIFPILNRVKLPFITYYCNYSFNRRVEISVVATGKLLWEVKGGGQGQAISKAEVIQAADAILQPLMDLLDGRIWGWYYGIKSIILR